MALSEEQIQRYSRQILLREVGGRGQEALLGARVHADVAGAAGLTAAAYLAAAGSPLAASPRALEAGAAGFLVDAADVGAPASTVLARALPDFNPDALGEGHGAARLAELPARFEGSGPWVALGTSGEQGALLYRAPAACAACFDAAAATLGPAPAGAPGVMLGALGALVLQRLVLGQGPEAGLLLLSDAGALSPGTPPRCVRCG